VIRTSITKSEAYVSIDEWDIDVVEVARASSVTVRRRKCDVAGAPRRGFVARIQAVACQGLCRRATPAGSLKKYESNPVAATRSAWLIAPVAGRSPFGFTSIGLTTNKNGMWHHEINHGAGQSGPVSLLVARQLFL
jgi:hypothetical protein